jgi:hypothetical protein
VEDELHDTDLQWRNRKETNICKGLSVNNVICSNYIRNCSPEYKKEIRYKTGKDESHCRPGRSFVHKLVHPATTFH